MIDAFYAGKSIAEVCADAEWTLPDSPIEVCADSYHLCEMLLRGYLIGLTSVKTKGPSDENNHF